MLRAVRISAIWCMSCLVMRPRYDELLNANAIPLTDFDFDKDQDVIARFKVGKVLPVVILFEDDVEITRIIGERNRKELAKLLEAVTP